MSPIFVAIDTISMDTALNWARAAGPHVGGVKLGLEFFSNNGPQGVREVQQASGKPIFLDVKLHDIPNTVAGAVRALCPLGVTYITIHTSGGEEMMRAAAEAAEEGASIYGVTRPKLLGVTVLTSLESTDLLEVGQDPDVGSQVHRLASLAIESGLDGLVCAASEITQLRAALGPDVVLMVPGIRPAGSAEDDQKRTKTPQEAMALGATHLVIGRPITQADDPGAAAATINQPLVA
ncbi:MAG: orotidine-5'-phosphate decarboxylase [Pseudomonadota bacterium]